MQQLYERYLSKNTWTTENFHTLLQCLILGVKIEVDDTIKYTNETNIFEFTTNDIYHSTTIVVFCLSNKNGYLPIEAVIINLD